MPTFQQPPTFESPQPDDILTQSMIPVSGWAHPGSHIEILNWLRPIGEATADAQGQWTLTLHSSQEGDYMLVARIAGTPEELWSDPLSFTVVPGASSDGASESRRGLFRRAHDHRERDEDRPSVPPHVQPVPAPTTPPALQKAVPVSPPAIQQAVPVNPPPAQDTGRTEATESTTQIVTLASDLSGHSISLRLDPRDRQRATLVMHAGEVLLPLDTLRTLASAVRELSYDAIRGETNREISLGDRDRVALTHERGVATCVIHLSGRHESVSCKIAIFSVAKFIRSVDAAIGVNDPPDRS